MGRSGLDVVADRRDAFAMLAALLLVLTASCVACAEVIPAPVGIRSPGTIELAVDATDVDKRIVRVRETIPVRPGRMTLLYPQWVPGAHAPGSSITLLSGLKFSVAGKRIAWKRDPLNMHAFHVEVPSGVDSLDAEFQYLSPLQSSQGRIVVTADMLGLQWHTVVLYPAGYRTDGIAIRPSLSLPAGWQYASALEVEAQTGSNVHFRTVSLTDLVDSPVFAGRYFRHVDLDPGGSLPVMLDMVADLPANLAIEPEQVTALRSMVQQSYKVFGPPPYRQYDFLAALSETFSPIALEHQASTELGKPAAFFTKWKSLPFERPDVPHEFVHVWNGKLHRPLDLATPNFNVEMGNSLLWVYEGQTNYWTFVLASRSGVMSAEETRQFAARAAALLDQRAGRSWRNLQDTLNDPIMRLNRQRDWPSWQRVVDYYAEGFFLWLEIDAKIRELSAGKRSLNDFAASFFGRRGGAPAVITYTFDDVVAALNALARYPWAGFLNERLESNERNNAIEALKAVGWQLVFKDKPTDYSDAIDRDSGDADFLYSLGLVIGKGDKITLVQWDSPAFKAGLAGGATVLAVNGRSYKADALKQAIAAGKDSKQPIELLVKSDDLYRTLSFHYDQGLRYPHLERIPGTTDLLSLILEPLP
jgi:predicted metalloprotease with PDZ domain